MGSAQALHSLNTELVLFLQLSYSQNSFYHNVKPMRDSFIGSFAVKDWLLRGFGFLKSSGAGVCIQVQHERDEKLRLSVLVGCFSKAASFAQPVPIC